MNCEFVTQDGVTQKSDGNGIVVGAPCTAYNVVGTGDWDPLRLSRAAYPAAVRSVVLGGVFAAMHVDGTLYIFEFM